MVYTCKNSFLDTIFFTFGLKTTRIDEFFIKMRYGLNRFFK